MNQVKVKFCGLCRSEDITYANSLLPDYVGFVFAESKRQVSVQQAKDYSQSLKPGIRKVGVFVDANPDFIMGLLQEEVIDLAQLHGKETVEEISYIRKGTGKPVIKALKESDFYLLPEFDGSDCDFLLLDSGAGTGTTFDWSRIETIQKPFFLAGGITAENVLPAMEQLHPYAIDVSSGIETNGKKDFIKMQQIIRQIHEKNKMEF